VEYDKVISQNDDDERLGGVRYRELLAMQLALCDDPEFPELDWFIPFIYLDKDSPRLCGREIYGYPKQIGDIPEFIPFKAASAMEPARKLELRGLVIPQVSEQEAEPKPIVTIEALRAPATIAPYGHAYDMILDLLKVSAPSSVTGPRSRHLFPADIDGLAPTAASGSRGVEAMEALLSGTIGHVFLKQFRDCAQPMTACYQAVCKTDTMPGRFRGGARIDHRDYRIAISNFASERLLELLGRDSEPAQPITPDFAYWMDLDIELTTGRVIANALEPGLVDDQATGRFARQGPGRRVRRSREPNL